LRRLNYDQLIVYYRKNSKLINILRYKQEDKKFIQLFFNKNDVKSSNAKEVLILSLTKLKSYKLKKVQQYIKRFITRINIK